MTALDEIHALENKINDGLKRIGELQAKRARSEDNAKKLNAAIGAAQARVTHHSNNRSFVKKSVRNAERHDDMLKEYAATLKHLESAKITVEDSKRLLAVAQSADAACDTEIAFLNGRIAKWRAELAEYGQVIEVDFRRAA